MSKQYTDIYLPLSIPGIYFRFLTKKKNIDIIVPRILRMLQTIYYIKTPIVNSTNMFISTKTPRNPFPDSASTFPAT